MECIVLFKANDEVVFIGANKERTLRGVCLCGGRVGVVGAEDDLRSWKAREEVIVAWIGIDGITIGINDGKRLLCDEFSRAMPTRVVELPWRSPATMEITVLRMGSALG